MSSPTKLADLEARHRRYDEGLIFERFHRGELPEAEQQDFEEHFLTCDHCLDRLEAVERLQGAMREVAVEESTRRVQEVRVVQAVATVVWWRLWGQLGGALLLVVLSVGWWRLDAERDTLRSRLERASAPPSRTFLVPLDTVRNASEDTARRVDLTAESEWIVFTLQAPRTMERYLVGLEAMDGREVWRQEGVEADGSGQILVGLPSDILQESGYSVWLAPQNNPQERQDFPLEIERIGNP